MEIHRAIKILNSLGQEQRLLVFRLIVQKGAEGLTPGEIREHIEIPAATLSFHIKELAQAGLIDSERQGRNLRYRPIAGTVESLTTFLLADCCGGKSCSPK